MSKKGPLRHCLLDRFFFLYLSHNFGFPFFSFSFAYLPECSPSSILQTSMGVPKQPQGLESPLDCKEIKPVYPKGNQSWIFIGRTDTETPILWPPDVKNWLTGKDLDPGKDWRQEKGSTEDEMVGWHHQLNGHEFKQASGVGIGLGRQACCSPWGRKESDMTQWLNWSHWTLK